MDRLFLDTSFAIALASNRDQQHEKAVTLASEIRENKAQLVTTIPVVIEIGNSLAKRSFRQAAVQLITSLHTDSSIMIVPLDHDLYARSFKLFVNRSDKDWGLTDCVSFVVMDDQKIRKALTADAHFTQAGFEALLAS